MPKISILTPTYNHARYIGDCIASVQAQTFSDWEMIVLDDGSTDGTSGIVQAIAAQDARISYVHFEHRGPEFLKETYNEGLRRAKGDYIAVLEGDDIWLPHKLKLQWEAASSRPGVVCVWSRAEKLLSDGTTHPMLDKPLSAAQRSNTPKGSFTQVLLRENPVPALTLFFSANALRSIGGFDSVEGLPLVDLPTLLRMSTEGEFCLIDESLGHWRQHASQVTKTKALRIIEGVYAFRKKFIHEHMHTLEVHGVSEEDLLRYRHKSELSFYTAQCFDALKKRDWTGALQWSNEMKAYSTHYHWKHRLMRLVVSFLKLFVSTNTAHS